MGRAWKNIMDSLMDGASKKYFGLLRAGSDVENRWGSCGKRGFGWGFYIWKDMGREVGKGIFGKVPSLK